MMTFSETRAPGAIDLKQPNTTAALPRLWKAALASALCAAAFSQTGLAQAPPASVLRIDTVNAVNYDEDTGDVSKFATDPGTPTHTLVYNFNRLISIADIQAVNGQPAMGVLTRVGPNIALSTALRPTYAQTLRG